MSSTLVQLRFLQPRDTYQHEKPFWLFVSKPDQAEMTNVVLESVTDIPLHDVRGNESSYNLDQNGFQFVTHEQQFTAFDSDEQIKTDFVPQVESLILKNIAYASKVHVFDWRVSFEIEFPLRGLDSCFNERSDRK